MAWQWPVRIEVDLPGGDVLVLRPLTRRDKAEWVDLRERNADWLRPWEAGVPGERRGRSSFGRLRRGFEEAGRVGAALPFVLENQDRLVGTMQIFDVLWGSRATGSAGYWLDRGATGRGLATWGLAALLDHALLTAGLHRVEIGIRPENTHSLAVVQRLAIPEEGVRRGLMYVDGGWRDHRTFALVQEDLSSGGRAAGGLLRQLRADRP